VAPGSVTVGAFEPTDHPCAQHIQPALRTPAYHIAPDPQLCQESRIFTLLASVLWIVGVIFSILGFTNAKDGQHYRYPFALRLIK